MCASINGFNPFNNIMKASDFCVNGKRTANPVDWWLSEKLDGMRAIYNGNVFLTRNSVELNSPEWFFNILPNDKLLDGELYFGRNKFEHTGVCRRSIVNDIEWLGCKYMIFDLIDTDTMFEDRLIILKEELHKIQQRWDEYRKEYDGVLPKTCPVEIVEQTKVSSLEQATDIYKDLIKNKAEGIILRKPKSKYEVGRSSCLLKWKPVYDHDAIVVGYETGKGKNTGLLGSFIVHPLGEDGKKNMKRKSFKVGSGLSDFIRKNYLNESSSKAYHPIGTVICYKYRDVSREGKPRFPTYLRKRTDM